MSDGFVLDHPVGLRIQKDLLVSDARAIDGVTTRDHRNGYVWYYLPTAEIAGQMISMGLCFFEGRLEFISVSAVTEPDASPWATWDRAREEMRVEATRRWFADIGFPIGTYRWGVIDAALDPKTGDGSGAVRFV
jgi:hypothetical protein